jgi:hypothetical protein
MTLESSSSPRTSQTAGQALIPHITVRSPSVRSAQSVVKKKTILTTDVTDITDESLLSQSNAEFSANAEDQKVSNTEEDPKEAESRTTIENRFSRWLHGSRRTIQRRKPTRSFSDAGRSPGPVWCWKCHRSGRGRRSDLRTRLASRPIGFVPLPLGIRVLVNDQGQPSEGVAVKPDSTKMSPAPSDWLHLQDTVGFHVSVLPFLF